LGGGGPPGDGTLDHRARAPKARSGCPALDEKDPTIIAAKPTIRDILDRYEIVPKKRLGQNFLHDRRIAARIVEAAGILPGETVLEIGPGLGALTELLLASPGRVFAVELDARVLSYLEETFGERENLVLVRGDILEIDLGALLGAALPVVLVANLPYAITGPLLRILIDQCELFSRAVVMVQKEVATRIRAGSGGREIGAPSVFLRLLYRVEKLFDVGTGAFLPRPEVDSVVLRLTRRSGARLEPSFVRFVNLAYQNRRKTLRKTLAPAMAEEEGLIAALEQLGKSPDARPEDLEPEEWPRVFDSARGRRS
jgi:16S rRNA (adenine1518-N6/adenine1519-N6)-dimethyltransferase